MVFGRFQLGVCDPSVAKPYVLNGTVWLHLSEQSEPTTVRRRGLTS